MAHFLLESKEDDERQDLFLLKKPVLPFQNNNQFSRWYLFNENIILSNSIIKVFCRPSNFHIMAVYTEVRMRIKPDLVFAISRYTVFKPASWQLLVNFNKLL